jgi:hypothetical protein
LRDGLEGRFGLAKKTTHVQGDVGKFVAAIEEALVV